MSDMNDLDRQRLEQLRKYAEWDRVNRQGPVGKLHVLDWAATEIETLRAKVAELEAGNERVPGVCISESGWPALVPTGSEDIDGRKPLYTTPQPVKVPDGWRMWAGDNGLMCIQHPEYGGTAARDSEDAPIAEVALHYFIKTMLSAQNN